MKKLSIALAAAFAIGSAAPALAADYIGPAPAPMTCMDYVNAHYGAESGLHSVLAAPFYVTHAALCHVFHHDGYYGQHGW